MKPVQPVEDGPRRRPPLVGGRVRNLFRRLRDSIRLYEGLHRDHGPVVRFKLLHLEICAVFDAELIQQVLDEQRDAFDKGRALQLSRGLTNPTVVTASGPEHRRRRRLIQPFFHKKAIGRYVSTIVDKTAARRDAWRENAAVDLCFEFRQLVTEIAIDVFFGNEITIDAEDLENAKEYVKWDIALTMVPGHGVIERLPWPHLRRLRRAGRVIDDKIREAIRRASDDGPAAFNLISLLVHAEDENGGGRAFNDSEVRDEALVMLLVSQDTLNIALQWCFHHLGRNPAARDRLIEEIDKVLGGRPAAPDDFADLVYTRAVFDETMRLSPPTFLLPRTAVRDVVIGGWFLPEGTNLHIYWPAPHRDARHFPNPDRFLPERWLDDASDRPKYAYGPFGGGARACPGDLYAKMTAVYVMATVAQRWRLDIAANRPLKHSSLVTYAISNGLPATPVARTDGPPRGTEDDQSSARLATSIS